MDMQIDLHSFLAARDVRLRFNLEAAHRSLNIRIIDISDLEALGFERDDIADPDLAALLYPDAVYLTNSAREEDSGFLEGRFIPPGTDI